MVSRHLPTWSLVVAVIAIGIVLLGVGQATMAQRFQPLFTPTPTQPALNPDIPILIQPIATIPPERPTEVPISPTEPSVIPTEESAEQDQEPAEPPTGTGSVTVVLRACGIYIDPLTIADPSSCIDPYDGVVFDLILANSGGIGPQATTGSAGTGTATFTNVAAGDYVLGLNAVPDAYQSAFLWNCVDNTNGTPLFNPPAADYVRASLTIGEGQAVTCDWYMVEDDPTFDMSVDKFSCPEGTDRTLDFLTLKQLCPYPLEGISFQTHDYDLGYQTTDANGHAGWTDVTKDSQGKIGIGEEVPAGYGEPVVWCATVQTGFDTPFDSDYVPVDTAGGWFELTPELHAPYIFTCAYFNMPLAVADQVLTIHARLCQPGSEDIGTDLDAACLEPANDVAFTVTSPTGTSSQTTAFGETTFQQVAGGEISITGAFPAGYDEASVKCQGSGIWSGSGIDVYYPTYSNDFEGANFPLVCVFSYFPIEEQDNQVTLLKWDCPPGTSYGLQAHEYTQLCTTEMSDVPFVLTDDLGDHPLASQAGGITWSGVVTDVAKSYQITETVPDGYGEPISFCWPVSFDAGPNDATAVVGDTFVVDRPPSTDAWHERCNVYNIPGDGSGGIVTIEKHLCADVQAPGNIEGLLIACQEYAGDTTFLVEGPNGYSISITTNGFNPNAVSIAGVPFGSLTITETVPAGYGEPLVLCDILPHNTSADFESLPVSGGAVTVEMDEAEGDHLVCHVFNMPPPPGDNTVLIDKFRCPEGTGATESFDFYLATCIDVVYDAEFTVTTAAGMNTVDTSNGQIVMTQVPDGTVEIQEQIPAGFGAPVIFCNVDGTWFAFDSPSGYVARDVANAGVVACMYFNIPADGGSITIEKHLCPVDFDLAGLDPPDALAICPGTDEPFTFSATGPNGSLPDQQIGDLVPGAVQFNDLPAGSYTITETVPAGYTAPIVLRCDGFISGQLQPYPLATGNSLTIDLADGDHLTCYWLNVPESDPNTGTLTIIKYTCGTETFISTVDCQIEEDGQDFSLSIWDGDSYEPFVSGTTNAVGEITWTGLGPGTYLLEETGTSWCHLVASIPSPPDVNGLMVEPGQENVVQVFNCDGTPGDPGETPTKYPDTGVEPFANDPASTVSGASMLAPGRPANR